MPAASIEAFMSAIGIDPVAQRPSRGLTVVAADGDASGVAEGDADAATTTVALGVGLVDGVAAAEQPTSARARTASARRSSSTPFSTVVRAVIYFAPSPPAAG
jgi:hypothetical protein